MVIEIKSFHLLALIPLNDSWMIVCVDELIVGLGNSGIKGSESVRVTLGFIYISMCFSDIA